MIQSSFGLLHVYILTSIDLLIDAFFCATPGSVNYDKYKDDRVDYKEVNYMNLSGDEDSFGNFRILLYKDCI